MAQERTVPESKIFINNREIAPNLRAAVLEVVVCQYVEGACSFEITLNMLDPENHQLQWVDAGDMDPGNSVEIKMGYADRVASMITGEITALQPLYVNKNESPKLKVQGFDRLHRLRRGRQTRTFMQMKDSQIAEQIGRDLGLSPEAEDSGIVHGYVLQNNLSDIDFLLERARRIRYELLVEDQRLIFRRAANHLGKTISLEYMKDLKYFFPRLSTANMVSEVTVRGWNQAAKEAILGVARQGDETTTMGGARIGPVIAEQAFGRKAASIVTLPVNSQTEALQIAKAKFNDMAEEFISGEGEAVGNEAIMAGTTMELNGLGARFSGRYYIKRTEHRIAPRLGYITKFNVTRNAS